MDYEFEFDPTKSKANNAKHGIDLVEAQTLWLDVGLNVVPIKFGTELRWAATGRCRGKLWTAIYTMRKDKIRLISVRRARKLETEDYEKNYR